MIYVVVEERAFIQSIGDTATAEKKEVVFFQDEAGLTQALSSRIPQFLLLDVNVTFLDGPAWVERFKQDPTTRSIPVVVFGSSLRADLLQDAQEAGANKILPKSAFMAQLPGLLRHYSR